MRGVVVVSVLAQACATLRAPPAPAAGTGVAVVEGRLAGERFLHADAERARRAGASALQVVAVDAGAQGDRVSGFVRLGAHDCALLIARGSVDVDDIDLFAYGDDGSLLGADERPDRTPALLVCPPHPGRIHVSARVAAGYGTVAIGAQRVPTRDAARVGRALELPGHGGATEALAAIERPLAEHRRGIGGRWQELRRAALDVEPGTPALVSAVVEPSRCVDAWVMPTEAVSHLDVALLDAEGRVAGRAVAHGRSRFLVACAPEKAAFTLEVRPQSGRGIAVVVLSQSRDGERPELDAHFPLVELGPTTSVGEASGKLAGRLAKGDYDPPQRLLERELPIGQRTSRDLDLSAGCTRLDVIGGRPLSGVEAWLWSADGSLLSHDRGGAGATLFACGKGGPARLDLEAAARPGPVVVEQRRLRQVPPLLPEHPLAASRLLGAVLARGTVARVDQIGAPHAVRVSESRRAQQDVSIPLARCADVMLALGPDASGAEVRIVDRASGAELDRGVGRHRAAARACALDRSSTLEARVELSVASGATTALTLTRTFAPRE